MTSPNDKVIHLPFLRRRLMRKLCYLLLLCLPMLVLAHNEQETHYDRINLTASASGQVDNDTIIATLSALEEGKNVAGLADRVNQRIRWGMDISKKNPQIKVQTQAYNTQPVYHKSTIKGWRVSQSFQLESQDVLAVNELLSELQSKLNLQGISFEISPKRRHDTENKLIVEALATFNARAKLVATELGHADFRLVNMQVSTSGSMPPSYRSKSMRMEMMSAKVAAPSLEAGESSLTITVNGEIELR
jgi:predicted secreted protein